APTSPICEDHEIAQAFVASFIEARVERRRLALVAEWQQVAQLVALLTRVLPLGATDRLSVSTYESGSTVEWFDVVGVRGPEGLPSSMRVFGVRDPTAGALGEASRRLADELLLRANSDAGRTESATVNAALALAAEGEAFDFSILLR